MKAIVPALRSRRALCAVLSMSVLFVWFSGSAIAAVDDILAEREPVPATMAPLAPNSLLTDATRTDAGYVAVGQRGHILLSADGEDWEQVPVPVNSTLTSVHFVNRQHGWAGGHDATILKTRDGGRSWEVQQYDPTLELSVLDILFVNEHRGYAIGNFGYFLYTMDGGDTWEEGLVNEDESHLNAITRAPNGDLYIAGEFGRAYRSDDGGESWDQFETEYGGSYFTVLATDRETVLVAGLRGNAFVSRDQGDNWERLDLGTDFSIYGGYVVDEELALLVGENARVIALREDLEQITHFSDPSGNPLLHILPGPGDDYLTFDEEGVHNISGAQLEP